LKKNSKRESLNVGPPEGCNQQFEEANDNTQEDDVYSKTFFYSLFKIIALDNTHSGLFIKPDSLIKPCWDLIILILVIEQSLVIPFQMCFEVIKFEDL
jgi:hypothetical protein